jgi:hypothetical protein
MSAGEVRNTAAAERIRALRRRLRPFWLAIAGLLAVLGLPDDVSQAIGLAGVLADVRGEPARNLFLVLGLSLLIFLLVVPRVRSLLVKHAGLSARSAAWAVAVGFALFVVLGAVGLFRASPQAEGEAIPAAALEASEVPGQIGRECEAESLSEEEHAVLLRATAYVTCEPAGAGAEALTFASFGSSSDLADWLEEWRDHLGAPRGPCDGGQGYLGWADAAGKPQGTLLCGERDGVSYIVWTEESERVLGTVSWAERYEGEKALYAWWSKHVRQLAPFPDEHDRKLFRIARQKIRTGSCVRDEDVPATALASIVCDDPRLRNGEPLSSDSVMLALFLSESSLASFFDIYAETFARFAATEEHCPDSVLALGGWRWGEFVCFPAGGEQWLIWTNEREKIFGLMGRSDEDAPLLYDAWVALPF